MAKNVMKLLKPSPNLGKNGFDLSHRSLFDANMGELLPCCVLETVPDDNIEINVSDLLRAMPMITSPFMRVKQHIDFWFVPFNSMWHNWNSFITSRDEPSSSTLKYRDYCPHFNLKTLKSNIWNNNVVPNIHGSNALWKANAFRLLDLLGYPTFDYVYGDPSSLPTVYDNVDVNPWRLLAYQYIWYHEYRQKYYDTGSLGFQSVYGTPSMISTMFNVDFADCSAYQTADILSQVPSGIFMTNSGYEGVLCQMRYRPWKKDLFTGLLPSTQLGAVSTVSSTGSVLAELLSGATKAQTDKVNWNSVSNPTDYRLNVRDSSNAVISSFIKADTSFNILSLRSAQALQLWRENALRAGNQIQDNYKAHYGVEPHSHMIEHPVAIGSIDSPLNISDVVATAATSLGAPNDQVGDIAGRGISSMDGNKTIRFKTNDFGIVMGIFSLLPEAEYNSQGIDRPNQLLDRFDYFCPEMENVGLEAVDSRTFTINYNSVIPGYAPRYFGYKTKMDKAHLSFFNNPSINYANGPYRAWASAKYDVYIPNAGMPLSNLYVNPAIFDVNFVAAQSTGNAQFLVDMYNNISAVRPMSVTGMPSK